eukprot:6207328-Pleurochrysis_carterae.AAC.2
MLFTFSVIAWLEWFAARNAAGGEVDKLTATARSMIERPETDCTLEASAPLRLFWKARDAHSNRCLARLPRPSAEPTA